MGYGVGAEQKETGGAAGKKGVEGRYDEEKETTP